MFFGTVHHNTIEYPPLVALDADTLTKAKRRATAYFGNVHPDNDAVIVILQNGEPISKRRAAGGKWKDL